ncbi:MAG: riboflavin synthase [Myxococcota bacterium]
MFTGLVEDLGQIEAMVPRDRGARLTLKTALPLSEVQLGDSIAVDGACLTVVAMAAGRFSADLSEETLKRTAFAAARPGQVVHLERALRLGDRLGGHLVQGHVDAVGKVTGVAAVGDGYEVTWELPDELLATVVEKGSIAIDGVSLTVATLRGAAVSAAIVPHTASRTTLTRKAVGASVNVETDMIGKYVRRSLERSAGVGSAGLDLETLGKAGFL